MSRRPDRDSLLDIQEAIGRIGDYTGAMTLRQFLEDRKTQDAVIRNFEVIGEAAKNLSSDLRKSYPLVPWKDLAGVRDKMVHHYFGINYEIVWTIVKEDLPGLLHQIEDLLTDESE